MPNGNIDRNWREKLCGASEIAAFAGVTVAQVAHWRKEEWFPTPLDELRMGTVWDYGQVKAVLSERGYPKAAPYAERYPANRKRRKPQEPEGGSDVVRVDPLTAL